MLIEEYSHRWIMFCRYLNKSIEWKESDEDIQFTRWLSDKYREFEKEFNIKRPFVKGHFNMFDNWLLERAPLTNIIIS
jgi:hypothetical protein